MRARRIEARDLALALACVALSWWVYRAVPGGFFSPDDLIYLERARGLVPEPPGLWRFLSGIAWFHLLVPVFGAHPQPYLLANLALHGLCIVGVYAWVRSLGGGALAATVAAALFGTSRLHLTVLAQAVTVAEPLSLLLAIAALFMARMRSRFAMPLVLLAFTAALLCKETVLLLPLLLLVPDASPGPLRSRALRCAVLLAPGVLLALYLSLPSVHAAIFVNDVYTRAYGMNVFHNLMTLTHWALDFQTPTPDLYSVLSTTAWRSALWPMLGLALVAVLAWRATRLPSLGLAWWLLTLAPVLPLVHQRYLHYLYVPLAGLTIALGASLEWLSGLRAGAVGRRGAPARSSTRATIGWAIAAGVIAAQVAASDALLEERAAGRIERFGLPSDPFLRKAETARRAIVAVGKATGGRRMRAVFVIPEAGWTRGLAGVLHSILGEGLALRAVYPSLDSVAFVPRWTRAYGDFEVFYGRVDGNVVPLGRGPAAHVKLAALLIGDGCIEDARDGIAAAVADYPEDPNLRALRARLSER